MIETRVTRPHQMPERPKSIVDPSRAMWIVFTIVMSVCMGAGLILSTPIPERE